MAHVYQLVVSGDAAGQLIQSVLHYSLSEIGSFTAFGYAQELLVAWETSVKTPWLAGLSAEYNMKSCRAKKINGGGGPTVIHTYAAASSPGAIAQSVGSTQVASMLEFPAVVNGKNVTGKIFHAPLGQDDVLDNSISGATLTAENALVTVILTQLNLSTAGTADYVVYNRTADLSNIPLGGHIGSFLGTQRRRLHPV